jgi:hypothetical protein
MNADFMITIALCLYVLLGSLAVVLLFAQSIRDDRAKEAEAKQRFTGGETADRIRQPQSTRAARGSADRADRGMGVRSGAAQLARASTGERSKARTILARPPGRHSSARRD